METLREASNPVIQAGKHMLEKYLKGARHDGWSCD